MEDAKKLEESETEKKETKEKKKNPFLLHIIVINISLLIITVISIFSIKHFFYKKTIDSTIIQAKVIAEESIHNIGLQTIKTLKGKRNLLGISYFEGSAKKLKNSLALLYKKNKLASPPVIYSRSEKHKDFMYILGSGQLKTSPMDIYKIDEHVKDAYINKKTTSMLMEVRKSGISRPTILSTAPFTDKHGQVYAVLMMEFDIKKEMEAMSSSSTTIYGVGSATYLTLLLLFNFIFKIKKDALAESKTENIKQAS